MKKLFLLIACCVLSIGARADFSGSGDGTASNPYIIVNPNQLNELRNFLNDANVYFKLEDDIDLAKWMNSNNPIQGWQPIGVSASPFKGHLDGNGKTIKNFMINRTSNYVGMFGYLYGAEIKDLTIEGTVKGGDYTGGFAGYCGLKSKIVNVHFVGDVLGESNTGGLIGMSQSCTLNEISVKGNVMGTNTVGGVIGNSTNSNFVDMTYEGNIVANDNVGGICGSNDGGSSCTSCYAKGTVNANDYVGGIIGIFPGMSRFDMISCGSFVDITANSYVGGLCGKISGDIQASSSGSIDSHINKCFSIGSIISAGSYVGGLIGYAKGYNSRSYTFNKITYTDYYNEYINNSYFNGTILGRDYVGGLIGWTYGSKLSKNYCAASINGNSHVGGLAGRIDNVKAELKSNVALNTSVSAILGNAGRIYGSLDGNIGATVGTADENRALHTTQLSENGIVLPVGIDMQDGTFFGIETFKLRATYQGLGWDFANDWRNQETECYPYNPSQAAPPIILSGAVAGSTTIHGKSYDGGTVFVNVGNKTYSTTCIGNIWDVTTAPQQAGDLIRAYAVVDDLSQSYYTTQYVEYKGSGTEENPYQIFTAEDLAGLNGNYYYKLMNDIDLSSYISANSPVEGWQPIGRNGAVMSHFDGNGHTISGLWCKSSKDYTGLFANASSNTICNLIVKVAEGKKVEGKNYTGILLGYNTNGTVENCKVIGDVEGENYAGGLIGRANGCVVRNSHISGNVAGTILVGGMIGEATNGSIAKSSADTEVSTSSENAIAGGLVGNNSAIITESYSTGSLFATGRNSNAGGLAGSTTANVTNCFSAVNISMATEGVYMGGLVGTNYATVEKCYAAGNLDGAKWAGGLVGENIGNMAFVKNSFAVNHIVNVKDPQGYAERVIGGYKDGASTPDKSNYAYDEMQVSVNNVPMVVYDDIINGIAKSGTELQIAQTYSELDWDFTSIWSMEEGEPYPVHLWKYKKLPVESIILNTEELIIPQGETSTITYTIEPLDATNKKIIWTSSVPTVATVENGVITALQIGETDITATAEDGSGVVVTCKVTVCQSKENLIAELQKYIDSVKELCESSKEGDNIGEYAPGAKEELLGTINTIQNLISNAMETETIQQCTIDLNNAVEKFNSLMVMEGADTDLSSIANAVYVENTEVKVGTESVLSLKMKNNISATGYQCDVYLPEGFTFVTDEDGFAKVNLSTERTTELKTNGFDSSILPNGALRILCYSTKNYAFSGNDGEVCTIAINVPEGIEEGDYPIVIKATEITDDKGNAYNVDYVKSTLTVYDYMLGDANGDRNISVSDISTIASYILGTPAPNFIFKAADVNQDGNVSVSDISKIANMILNGNASKAKGFGFGEGNYTTTMTLNDVSIVEGKTADVFVSVTNPSTSFDAYQFDVKLPAGVRIKNARLSTERTNASYTNFFDYEEIEDNVYRVLCYSTRGMTFDGNDGSIARITLEANPEVLAGEHCVEVINAELSCSGSSIKPIVVNSKINIGETTNLNTAIVGKGNSTVYDAIGRRIEGKKSLSKGLYIIDGKKKIIK